MKRKFEFWDVIVGILIPAVLGAWLEDWIQVVFHLDIDDWIGFTTGLMVGIMTFAVLAWIRIGKLFWDGLNNGG